MHCTTCFPIQLPVLTGMLQIQKYKDNDSKDKCKKMKEEIKFPLLNSDIGLLPYRAADNHNQPAKILHISNTFQRIQIINMHHTKKDLRNPNIYFPSTFESGG